MWRIFRAKTYDAYTNMAIDEALVNYAKRNPDFKSVRFFRFGSDTVTISEIQDYREVNLELGIAFVRRPTGGRGLYHHPLDLAYSIVVPRAGEFEKHRDAKFAINQYLLDSLKHLGIEADYNGSQTITVKGKKIAGSAMNSLNEPVLLQHGSVFYENTELRLTAVPAQVKNNTEILFTSVKEHADVTPEELEEAFLKGFPKGLISELPEEVISEAEELAKYKYRTPEWNNRTGVQRGNCALIWSRPHTYKNRDYP